MQSRIITNLSYYEHTWSVFFPLQGKKRQKKTNKKLPKHPNPRTITNISSSNESGCSTQSPNLSQSNAYSEYFFMKQRSFYNNGNHFLSYTQTLHFKSHKERYQTSDSKSLHLKTKPSNSFRSV